MVTEALLSLAASGEWGVSEFLAKLSSDRNGPATTLVVAQSTGLAVVTAAVVVTGEGRWEPAVVLPVAALGLLNLTGFYAFYRALARGKLAIVSPIVSTSPALTVLLAFLILHELLPPEAWVAIGAILGGIAVMAVRPGKSPGDGVGRLAPGVVWALWTFFTLGTVTFLLKLIVPVAGPIFTIFLFRLGAVGFLLPMVLVGRVKLPQMNPERTTMVPMAVGALDTTGFILFNFAISTGSLTVATVLSGLYTVVALLLAWSLLRERLGPLQIGGMGAAVGGTVLLLALLP